VSACSAYIDEVIQYAEGTGVVLRPPSGRRMVWIAESRPDHDAASALRDGHPTVFAVHVMRAGGDLGCSVLVGTDRGARSLRASLEVGLALCQTGTHGVVRDLAYAIGSQSTLPIALDPVC
jgi:hypothetical protein